MMDRDERELFSQTVREAVGGGGDLDPVLEQVGFADALAEDERTAVGVWFDAQGAVCGTSTALLLTTGSVVPPLGSMDPPRSEGLVLGEPPGIGLDPDLGLHRVELAEAPEVDDWPGVVALGQRALGHELVGASRTMLRLAREHAVDRIQFGRPIGSFQAVRHRLAEALVAVEAADAALDAAWEDATPWSAMAAKAVAGQSARTVRRHCQQVLAGIGFTTEHDLHRFVRRTMVLDALFGDSRTLTARIGQGVLDAGAVPPLTPL